MGHFVAVLVVGIEWFTNKSGTRIMEFIMCHTDVEHVTVMEC